MRASRHAKGAARPTDRPFTHKKAPQCDCGAFMCEPDAAWNYLRFIVALRMPVVADFSPANGFSLRIIHG